MEDIPLLKKTIKDNWYGVAGVVFVLLVVCGLCIFILMFKVHGIVHDRAFVMGSIILASTADSGVPCVYDARETPVGCNASRVREVQCNTVYSEPDNPLHIQDFRIVQFGRVVDSTRDACYEITVQVGENWGIHPVTGALYACLGTCSENCGINGNWTTKCLKYTICNWFFSTANGYNSLCSQFPVNS